MEKTVAVIGTLDTKGQEFLFLKQQIEKTGLSTLVINAGPLGAPAFTPDISAQEVAEAAGADLEELIKRGERAEIMAAMSRGAAAVVKELYAQGRIHGVISLGGGQGTLIGATAMQALPVGVPKVMVSTIAAVDPQPFVDIKDVTMMNPVVDISGMNSILRMIIGNAAGAVAGMVRAEKEAANDDKPRIGMTMFGATTPCAVKTREILEAAGFEVLVFAATGVGDRAMEDLIRSGYLHGVADITTSNVGQEMVGGVNRVGGKRLEAAGERGIPQVVSLGGLDFVNFLRPETVPARFKGRRFHPHNPTVTLMRTSVEENIRAGEAIARKLNKSSGPATVAIPKEGLSAYDAPGQPFYDPPADAALFESLKKNISGKIKVVEVDSHINDEAFARRLAELMLAVWGSRTPTPNNI